MFTLLSSAFSRHAIVPNLRPATLRSFYRTVDFDGFIRTLYSQSLYSRDLKSLIIGARQTSSARRENYEKRDTVVVKGRGRAGEKEGRRLMSAKAYVGLVINLRKRASYLESCATPLFIFSKFLRLTGLSAFRYRSPSCASDASRACVCPLRRGRTSNIDYFCE